MCILAGDPGGDFGGDSVSVTDTFLVRSRRKVSVVRIKCLVDAKLKQILACSVHP
jgi:hypothetical protein